MDNLLLEVLQAKDMTDKHTNSSTVKAVAQWIQPQLMSLATILFGIERLPIVY